jgi:glycerophosphoryl diester phosphodiesterase
VIIGHRGAAGHAPENTEAAFAAAVALGADAVEFDIQFTSDGYPVVFHDETLERMAGVPVRVRDYTESVLKGFDIGFRHGARFRGERIPCLEEVARAVPPPLELHVELKDYEPVTEDHLRRTVETLSRSGDLERAIFSSPHEDVLTEMQRLAPEARRALLLFGDVKVPNDAARRAAHIGCYAVNPNKNLVTAELVDICHRHHMKVFAFTVNERGTMNRLLEMGVNGFFTDYPDRLREAGS